MGRLIITSLGLFFILGLIVSCQKQSNTVSKPEKFPIIIDNWTPESTFLNETAYHPLYIGPLKDTIRTNYFTYRLFKLDSIETIHLPNYYPIDTINKRVPNVYLNHFKIFDPSFPDPTYRHYRSISLNDVRFDIDFNQSIHKGHKLAVPLLIYNKSIDTVSISSDNDIPLKLQALDSSNLWKDIESPFRMKNCTGGGIQFSLPPKNVTVTSVIIPNGDYKTSIRLEFGKIHSIPISASINYQGFNETITLY